MNKKIKIILVSAIALILIIVGGFFLLNLSPSKANLEKDMGEKAKDFYEKYIKGNVIGVHKQKITLQDLKNQEYDISKFEKANCSLESYTYVILENPNETDKDRIKYTLEHHLDCDKK